MSVTFPRTLRSLRGDRQLWRFAVLTWVLILPLVLLWFFWEKISVYEASVSARLEAVPQSVAAEVEGRIVESKLHIGLSVSEGEVLVVLDGENILRLMEETKQQILSAMSGIEAFQQEIEVKQQSLVAHKKAGELAILESQKLQEVARSRAGSAQKSLERASPATLVLRAAGDFLMTQRVVSSSQ